ncbi:MAG: YkgJ family cysteine cluster protein [Azonexus sp.]|nr:YkgJ family cysteine cluster protein [Azonexus sp.]
MPDPQIALPQEDGRVFYDMAAQNNPCFRCGLCCRHYRLSFYHGELDSQPGGTVPAELATSVTPFRACMRGTEQGQGRCIALGESGQCTIYEHRPSPCREFPAFLADGQRNPECLRLQTLYGLTAE